MDKKITDFLGEYQDLWYTLGDSDCPITVHDASYDMIDEADYYGCNFTGRKKMLLIFYLGSSDHFIAIWAGNN